METKGLYPSLASSAQAPGGCRRAGPIAMGARRHRRRPSARWMIRTGVLLGIFAISTLYFAALGRGTSYDNAAGHSAYRSRHLLASNATGGLSAIESCDFEMQHVTGLFVVVYVIFILIFFISLAIICDDFFVPSLEVISERLELSEDVAGATFMAAGSSAPELFTSLAGVTVESDVGVGTIVGSALFNILIIIALSAALAGQVLQLDWRPLLRDSICYGVSIICFIIFSWDGIFEIYEAIVLLALYVVYIAIMKFNSSIMDLNCKRCRKGKVEPLESENSQAELGEVDKVAPTDQAFTPAAATHQKQTPHTDRKLSIISTASGGVLPRSSSSHKHIFHHVKHGELAANFASKRHSITVIHHEHPVLPAVPAKADDDKPAKQEMIEEDEIIDEELTLRPIPCLPAISMYYPDREVMQSRCGCLRYALKWLMFVISFPFMCAFTWTIPNCSNPKYKRFYVLSFTLSIVWIAVLSFAMVTLVIKVGCILNIDHYAMGIVFVAIGTSVPDALSSVLVARDGFGDMAVSNAIGSNVFDINLGLGLPFLISILIYKRPLSLLTDYEFGLLASGELLMTPHAKFGFILLGILLLTLFVFTLVRFKLNKVVGVTFVCIYVLFLIYAFLQEVVCKYVC
ncbi:sodium/potassium/calcium exchanger 2-like [Patiria miniata]|uniref:Sodium/calcium exchanger membrane region domain-containing protein n=1 Tax=Patiria miniata TaxID=46514 RepID=A0A913ZF35_PATMI|nr:sodium/potassium/calcium exchanger 2-like [Patiria miniata]XP_038050398.1 sodium/potassium/calcium exchanger 2-like [Patiria miniata]